MGSNTTMVNNQKQVIIMKLKELKEQVMPELQKLDDDKKHFAQELLQQVQEQSKTNGFNTIQEQIAERQEALQEIKLKREIKQLNQRAEQIELDLEPIEVDFKVPKGLENVFKLKLKKKSKKK